MKIHVKKKLYRAMIQKLAKAGMINDASGRMVQRPAGGNSMMRDYYPQGG